jgi:hypothetical protein
MKPITIAGVVIAIALIAPTVAQAQYGHTIRVRRRTAVVVGTTVHAADQAAAQQHAAQQQAAQPQAAAAPAAPAPAPAATPAPTPVAPGQPMPIGAVVPALPSGCTSTTVSGVEYYHCGPDWYRAMFQGDQLVYVTTPMPQ